MARKSAPNERCNPVLLIASRVLRARSSTSARLGRCTIPEGPARAVQVGGLGITATVLVSLSSDDTGNPRYRRLTATTTRRQHRARLAIPSRACLPDAS
jgi:hypothetical protein